MVFDFAQFAAQFVILMVLLRFLQAKFKDTEWGKALAFLG